MEEILTQIIEKKFKTNQFEAKNVSNLGNALVYIVSVNQQNVVVRITNNPYVIQNNVHSLKLLERFNVSPKIIDYGIINSYEYSIETFLFGDNKDKIEVKWFKKLFTKLLLIHSVKRKTCGYINNPAKKNWKDFVKDELILKYSQKTLSKYAESKKIIEYLLENIPNCDDYFLLQGDLNENNILFTNDDCFLFDFEGSLYGDKEYDIGYMHYRLEFSDNDLNKIITITKYNLWKIMYYAVLVGIRKVGLSPNELLKERIEKLKRIFEKLQNLKK